MSLLRNVRFATSSGELAPLVAVVRRYAIVRTLGADLEAAGGGRRLPKAIMALALMASVLAVAWRREHPATRGTEQTRGWWAGWPVIAMASGAVAALLIVPATSAAVARALGFVAYVAFYVVSPIVFPFSARVGVHAVVWQDAIIGLFVAVAILAVVLRFHRSVIEQPAAAFLCRLRRGRPASGFLDGRRPPLSLSRHGRRRAVSRRGCWAACPLARRLVTALGVTAIVVVSLVQLMQAGRRWRAAAEMQRAGVSTMADANPPVRHDRSGAAHDAQRRRRRLREFSV
jgi:hypothetical protein